MIVSDGFCSKAFSAPRAALFLALKLPASSLNVIAARPAHVDLHAGIVQNVFETHNILARRPQIGAAGMGIEWNHVDLARNAAQQLGKLARVLLGIVDAAQQDIFEGDALAPRYRQRAAAVEQLL